MNLSYNSKHSNKRSFLWILYNKKILKDGQVKGETILKVDSFLNHQIDIPTLQDIGKEFANRFSNKKVTKILTIEASGIAIATMTSQFFQNVPVIFAKKSKSYNLEGELFHSEVKSYTRGTTFQVQVSKKFIGKEDSVLIVDDFLASGNALLGLIEIVKQSGAEIAGCAIVIEKGFEDGGKRIRETGVQLESLAIIESMKPGEIVFKEKA